MPKIIDNVVRGALRVNGLPELNCFRSFADFIKALPELLSVEVPEGAYGVTVGADEPGEQDRTKLWVRRDNSGGLIGLYAFQGGAWKPLYGPVPGEVKFIFGDSNIPPEGWEVILPGDGTMPSEVVNRLVSTYVPNVGTGGYYYFAVRYVGF